MLREECTAASAPSRFSFSLTRSASSGDWLSALITDSSKGLDGSGW